MLTDKNKITVVIFLLIAFLGYSFFIYASLPSKAAKATIEVQTGKMVWQKYNCNSCHQVYGLGGYLGPDLTNVYSTKGADYIEAFLVSGTTIMPNFNLNKQEVETLIAYLQNIDASGKADPRTFKLNYDGTIEQ